MVPFLPLLGRWMRGARWRLSNLPERPRHVQSARVPDFLWLARERLRTLGSPPRSPPRAGFTGGRFSPRCACRQGGSMRPPSFALSSRWAALALAWSLTANAEAQEGGQGTVRGMVSDSLGGPLTGAQILV